MLVILLNLVILVNLVESVRILHFWQMQMNHRPHFENCLFQLAFNMRQITNQMDEDVQRQAADFNYLGWCILVRAVITIFLLSLVPHCPPKYNATQSNLFLYFIENFF